MNTDVLIVGGGAAGISAAIAAAESGLNVTLLERYGFLGGMATAAMVGTICGLYYRGGHEARFAVDGFARNFARGLARRSQTLPDSYIEGLHFLPYVPQAFHLEAARRLERAGVNLMLHATVCGVLVADRNINAVRVMLPDKMLSLTAGALVDCSGDAIISILAGQTLLDPSSSQAAALVFQVAGLPDIEHRVLALNLIRWIKKGVNEHKLHPDCARLSIVPGTLKNGNALLKLGMPINATTTLNSRTEHELLARERIAQIVAYLGKAEEPLRDLAIHAVAPQVGFRTGQRPVGREILTRKDVLSCAKPENGIAIGAWPIEKWGSGLKPEMTYFAENNYYVVPAGTLVARQLDTLFFAGRCLSATEEAIASARVMGTCLGTGFAAGKLAASQIQMGNWQTAIETIRRCQVISETAKQ